MFRNLAVLGLCGASFCGKKSSEESSTTSTESSSSITNAVPGTLAINAPTTAGSSATSLTLDEADADGTAETVKTADAVPPKVKEEGFKKKIENKGDSCAPTPARFNLEKLDCFGTEVTASSGTGITFAANIAALPTGSQAIRGGDSGITFAKSPKTGNVCMKEVLEYYMANVSEFVEKGVDFASATSCAAQKFGSKSEKPAVGVSVDVTEAVKTGWADAKMITVNSAKVKALTETVVQTDLNLTIADKSGNKNTFIMRLINQKPDNADGKKVDTDRGVLIVFEKRKALSQVGNADGWIANSIIYDNTKEKKNITAQRFVADAKVDVLTYLAKDGSFKFGDMAGNFSKDATFSARIGDMTRVTIVLDRADDTGGAAYAWQAGNNDPATRTFAVTVSKGESKYTGKAIAGYSIPFKDEATVGKLATETVRGFYCAWAQQLVGGTSLNNDYVAKVQTQDFEKAFTASTWTATDSKIKFKVAADCGGSDTTVNELVAVNADGTGTATFTLPKFGGKKLSETDIDATDGLTL